MLILFPENNTQFMYIIELHVQNHMYKYIRWDYKVIKLVFFYD